MKLNIQVSNARANSKVEQFAVNRLDLVVGRYGGRLGKIKVRLRDENDAKGGKDKTCSIDAKMIPRGKLHVAATEENIYAAVHKAVHRLESVIAKSVDRGHRGLKVRHKHGGLRHDTARVVDAQAASE